MRTISILLLAVLPAALIGCDLDVGFDDGFDGGDFEELPECVPAADRAALDAVISGAVVDFVTGAPIDATVDFNTAWDVASYFPGECAPLATFLSSGEEGFGPETVGVGSSITPPIALFTVGGDGLADTASDQTMVCDDERGDCANVDHTIAAPTQALAERWRRELEEGGMPNAGTRGLVVFQFNEADGSPAEGVVPDEFLLDEVVSQPDVDVRFLEPDRATLAPLGTAATTASGLAIIAIRDEETRAFIVGNRGEERWDVVGVLAPPGWLFLEDERPIVPSP